MTLGISQQADRSLRYKEMNGHSNELMDRFLPGLHAQEYHLVTLTAALQVDALSIYYAMVRFMPELQKLSSHRSAALGCWLMIACCTAAAQQSLNSLHLGFFHWLPQPASSLVQMLATEETYESSAFPFSL